MTIIFNLSLHFVQIHNRFNNCSWNSNCNIQWWYGLFYLWIFNVWILQLKFYESLLILFQTSKYKQKSCIVYFGCENACYYISISNLYSCFYKILFILDVRIGQSRNNFISFKKNHPIRSKMSILYRHHLLKQSYKREHFYLFQEV